MSNTLKGLNLPDDWVNKLEELEKADAKKCGVTGLADITGTGAIPSSITRGMYDNMANAAVTMPVSISVGDDQIVKFDNGFEVTGKKLSVLLRVLEDIAQEKFPEEFI